MAANDETDSGIDQCIVWWCHELRGTRWGSVGNQIMEIPTLHCRAHQGFAHVDQEANNGS